MGAQAGAVYFLGYADVDGSGNFSATLDIPEDIVPGRYTLQATGITQGGSAMALNLGAILMEDLDLDSDGDGVPDVYEYMQGTDPFNKDEFRDSNGDGVPDYVRERSPVEYTTPGAVQAAWGSSLAAAGLPEELVMVNGRGEIVILKVNWDISMVDTFRRGSYSLKGTLEIPKGMFNAYELMPDIEVVVLPKPAPTNILLSNNTFEGAKTSQELAIGSLTVVDPVDNRHVLGLIYGLEDNRYFRLINDVLYWSSEDPAAGRTIFKIVVRVTDRDFNTLDKVFTIERTRKSFSSIEVFNTFSPNQDGKNDTWGVPDLRYNRGVRIQVFDRGGDRLFYTENPDIRWDGTHKGNELPIGTYYWTIEVRETGEVRKGMLNLIRK
jgi:gliding motility-associated-like protein